MAAGSTYTPIATTTLGSAAASYTFSSIPSTYTDLVLVIGASMTTADYVLMQFNGDTGTNYSDTTLTGNGTSAASSRDTSTAYINPAYFSTGQNNAIINIQNYANITTYKTALGRGNNTTVETRAVVGLWRSTSAINSIKVYTYSGNTFATGSTFTLYGIAAA